MTANIVGTRERYFDRDCTAPTTQASCKQQIDNFDERLCYYHNKLAQGLLESGEGVEIELDDSDE